MKKIVNYLESKHDYITVGHYAYVGSINHPDEDVSNYSGVQTSEVLYVYYDSWWRIVWFETKNNIYVSTRVDHDKFCDNAKFNIIDLDYVIASNVMNSLKIDEDIHSIRSLKRNGKVVYDFFFHDEDSKIKFMVEYL